MRRPLWRRPLPYLLLAACIPVLGFFIAEVNHLDFDIGFPLDDGWIHLQFAKNLAVGNGLSYNPGELVTGSTAPLWTALLSCLMLLPGNPVFWTKVLGAAFHVLSVHATYRLSREIGLSEGFASLAGGLTLTTSWLVWSSLSGMEIPLFVLLTLWGLILHMRERRDPQRLPLAFVFFGLSVLARPEGGLLAILAVVDRLFVVERVGADKDGRGGDLKLRRPPWKALIVGGLLAVVAALPTLLFYKFVGGSMTPNTLAAKASSSHALKLNLRYIYLVLGIFFKPQPILVMTATAGAFRLLGWLGTKRDRGLLLAMWVFALPMAYSFLTPQGRHLLVGNFGRYYFPLFAPLAVLGVLGLERAAAAIGRYWQIGPVKLPIRALATGLVFVPALVSLIANTGFYTKNVANVRDSDVRMARWVNANVPPQAVLAVQDIGAIKYLTQNRIIDLVGLISPDILPYMRQTITDADPEGHAGVASYLDKKQPDFVLAYPEWQPSVTEDKTRMRAIHRFEIPENITMAGDEMVVYVTRWNRFLGDLPPLFPEDKTPSTNDQNLEEATP